jgi:hypothetical protein
MACGPRTRILNRRELARMTSVGVTCLMTGSLSERESFAAEGSIESNSRLIVLGLNAPARSPEYDYFRDGHRGASLVAAHLMVHDNGLDDAAQARILELFDFTWDSSPLCQPFP